MLRSTAKSSAMSVKTFTHWRHASGMQELRQDRAVGHCRTCQVCLFLAEQLRTCKKAGGWRESGCHRKPPRIVELIWDLRTVELRLGFAGRGCFIA